MAKEFITAGTCDPERHYAVDTNRKMKIFESLIDKGKYFTITRARQFGKSTSLNWILHNLSDDYLVILIDFANLDENTFDSSTSYRKDFCRLISENIDINYREKWLQCTQDIEHNYDLFHSIRNFCIDNDKPVVLLIDNADKYINIRLVELLCGFRASYQERVMWNQNCTFHSVVLSSEKYICNLPSEKEEFRYYSPWNIAATYDLDMTFNTQEISTMLADYENDNHIEFNIMEISEKIHKFTYGYPVLVSAVCKEIDENLNRDWTKNGVINAVISLVKNQNFALLKLLKDNIAADNDLKLLLRAILINKVWLPYNAGNSFMELAQRFSYIRPRENYTQAVIHNPIFQYLIFDYFVNESQIFSNDDLKPNFFITKSGDLNMPLIINRFKDLMQQKHAKESEFFEREGRFMFICFLKPIINGSGFYYSEPENDDGSRMDLVVTFNHKEYIIELKIWHGTIYEISGHQQLSEYLVKRNMPEGYLVTFSFLKTKTAQEKPEWIEHNGKRIYEAIIDCGVSEQTL